MDSSANNIDNNSTKKSHKSKILLIVIIIVIIIPITIIIINKNSDNKSSYNYYYADNGIYNSKDYVIEYDKDNNLKYFESEKEKYNMSYKYYYQETKLSKISFEGLYFGNELYGDINFEYDYEGHITQILITHALLGDSYIDKYIFHYDEKNRVNLIEHDNGKNYKLYENEILTDCCRYYYYEDKYIISDCYLSDSYQPNLKTAYITTYYQQTIYANDNNFNNIWVKHNIRPFIYYGIYFPNNFSSDVDLLGSFYSVPYNPGKQLYQKKIKEKTGNETETNITRYYYSNGNIIKAEVDGIIKGSIIYKYKDNLMISSIDDMNKNYEFTYSYDNKTLIEKKVSKDNYNEIKNDYDNYFKSSTMDYNIDSIIENLDDIIEKKYNETFAPEPTIETSLEQITDSITQQKDIGFEIKNADNVTFSFNNNLISCDSSYNTHYSCSLSLQENENTLTITASNKYGKEVTKHYTINFKVVAPSVKFEKNYYKVSLSESHWRPRIILSDDISNYNIMYYFDNQKWSYAALSYDEVNNNKNNYMYEIWVSKIGPGTTDPKVGKHTMKIEITDKRTGKTASNKITVDCY